MKDNKIVVIVVVAVLLAIAAFFGGMKYDQSQSTGQKYVGAYGQGRGGSGAANKMRGSNGASGEVLSMDDKSVTLKLSTGGSRIVLLSDKTQVMKSTSASKADLKVGLNLMVNGVTNADGSVTADNIQIRPDVSAPAATSVAK